MATKATPGRESDHPLAGKRLSGADIVDAAPLALSNALTQSQPRDNDQEGHVLLDAGHRGSWLTFRHRGLPAAKD